MRRALILWLILGGCASMGSERSIGGMSVSLQVEPAAVPRIVRFLETIGPWIDSFIGDRARDVRVRVTATREELKRLGGRDSMGWYDPETRTSYCSMQWGLGWLGDLVFRARLADDRRAWAAAPNSWYDPALVSMLYNCFRAADGSFHGLNVVSYYRPQAQKMSAEGRLFRLVDLFEDTYDRSKVKGDAIRVQGREFLAYLHSKGLLGKFHEAFRRLSGEDRSGIRAVESVLGEPLERVERRWLDWLNSADGEIGDSEMAKPFPVLGILMARGPGVVVTQACPGSSALRGGIREGDRIEEIAGAPVGTREGLVAALEKQSIGATIQVVVVREGKALKLQVTLDRTIDG